MKAFKCDRCDEYEDGEPEILKHQKSNFDNKWEKELCGTCYHGLIEYLIGESVEDINNWDIFSLDNE